MSKSYAKMTAKESAREDRRFNEWSKHYIREFKWGDEIGKHANAQNFLHDTRLYPRFICDGTGAIQAIQFSHWDAPHSIGEGSGGVIQLDRLLALLLAWRSGTLTRRTMASFKDSGNMVPSKFDVQIPAEYASKRFRGYYKTRWSDGLPIMTPAMKKEFDAFLMSRTCIARLCRAKPGQHCKGGNNFHFGRFPEGFRSDRFFQLLGWKPIDEKPKPRSKNGRKTRV